MAPKVARTVGISVQTSPSPCGTAEPPVLTINILIFGTHTDIGESHRDEIVLYPHLPSEQLLPEIDS